MQMFQIDTHGLEGVKTASLVKDVLILFQKHDRLLVHRRTWKRRIYS